MADKLTLKFRVGPQASTVGGKRAEDITAEVQDKLRKIVKERGLEDILAALFAGKEEILKEIRTDATRFAENAAKVMTKVRSPATGSIYVSVDDVNRAFVGTSSFDAFRSGNRLVENSHTVVSWNALTARTLANKAQRGRRFGPRGAPDQFFVDTGELRSLLITYLGPAFAALIDPLLVFKRVEAEGEPTEKVNVTLITMAKNSGFAKKGIGRDNLPFLNAGQQGNQASARSETIMVEYLKSVGARDPKLEYKLTNPRGAQRPFLQPVLAFWFVNRLPIVLERALMKALKSKKFLTRSSNRTV